MKKILLMMLLAVSFLSAGCKKDVKVVTNMFGFEFAVAATPEDAVVVINGEEQSSLTVSSTTEIVYSVSKEGYIPQTDTVSFAIFEDTILEVNLVEIVEEATLTINSLTEGAVVMINGEEQNAITVEPGDEVMYEVSKEGYYSQTDTLILLENKTLDIELVELDKEVTLVIKSLTEGAEVSINGEVRDSITLTPNSEVSYSVVKEGYVTAEETFTLTNDKVMEIELVKLVTLTITSLTDNATITINGEEMSAITVAPGTEVTYVVSKEHFFTKEEVITVDEDTDLEIELVSIDRGVTLTITSLTEGATIMINGEEQTSLKVEPNTEISYSVSKEGYITKEATFTITENTSLSIELEESVTLTINSLTEGATVTIDGQETTSLSMLVDTKVTYVVSLDGYVTQTETLFVMEDTSIDVNLTKMVTLNINSIVEGTTIMLNEQERSSISVAPYTVVTYVVTKEEYYPQELAVVVTHDATLDIELVAVGKDVELTINSLTSGATITIDGEAVSSATLTPNTEVTYSVSKDGYVAVEETITVANDTTIEVELIELVTLYGSINATANSYMAVSNNTYYIPINERINTFWKEYSGYTATNYEPYLVSNADTDLEIEVLWYDNGDASAALSRAEIVTTYSNPDHAMWSSMNYDESSVKAMAANTWGTKNYTVEGSTNVAMELKVASGVSGNVLVAVKKNDVVLWSWHLWVTTYDPYTYTTPTTNSGAVAITATNGSVHRYADASGTSRWQGGGIYASAVIMDRNLGAMSATWSGHGYSGTVSTAGTGAIYYQFGRKDPISGILNGSITTVAGAKDFAYSVQNPATYVSNSQSSWSSQDNSTSYMWNDKNVAKNTSGKSIFDPSPIGWKIPIDGTWSGFSTSTTTASTYGRTYLSSTISAFYPYQGGSSGSSVGEFGLYWSSTAMSTAEGYRLHFNSTSVVPSHHYYRTLGYPIRSVRDN